MYEKCELQAARPSGAVADVVWCICVYPCPTHFLVHGGSLLLCKSHKLLTDGQGEFVS